MRYLLTLFAVAALAACEAPEPPVDDGAPGGKPNADPTDTHEY